MKAEQKARKQEQKGTGRQRKHRVGSKKGKKLNVWKHEETLGVAGEPKQRPRYACTQSALAETETKRSRDRECMKWRVKKKRNVRRYVRKNDKRYVRKNLKEYVRKDVKNTIKRYTKKNIQKICPKKSRKYAR